MSQDRGYEAKWRASLNTFYERPLTFVIEEIETSEQRAEFERLGFVSPFNLTPSEIGRWLVDRGRGFYFVNLGGGGEDKPWFLALADKNGLAVKARGWAVTTGPYLPNSIDVNWRLESVNIARRAEGQADGLLTVLREALCAYGHLGNRQLAKSVQVTIPSPTFS